MAREELVRITRGTFDEEEAHSEEGSEGAGSEDERSVGASSEDNLNEGDGVPQKRLRMMKDLPPLARPSDYLRSRCPLCFGGKSCLADG